MMNRILSATPVAIMLVSSLTVPTFAQARKASYDAGTVIPVTLDRELNSKTNRTGDKFTARVTADKDGYTGLPEGAVVEGVIKEARAKEGDQPGLLDLSFQRVRLPNGRAYAIAGSPIGLDDKNIEKNSDGVLVAKGKSKNNRLTYLGYGAGAGLLASVIGGGGKIRLENIVLGAGLGYLAGSLEKNRKTPNDVTLKSGTTLGVKLDRTLSLTSYEGNNRVTDTQGNNLDRSRNDRTNGDKVNPDTGNGIGVLINDQNVNFNSNAQPLVSGGIVMVPVRPVADALSATLKISDNNQTIEAVTSKNRVRIGVGSRIAVVNGVKRVRLNATAKKINGTTYVPATFFDLLTGTKHDWDSQSQTLVISTNGR